MQMNSDKCHLFISGNHHEQTWGQKGDDKMWEYKTVKFLVITVDSKLKFDEHISNACMNTQRKLTVLTKISTIIFIIF